MNEMIDFDIPGPIGIQDIEVEQGLTQIITNRTLLVCSLQKDGPFEPEEIPQHYTKSLTRLFEYGKPEVEVNIETGDEDNPTEYVTINYDTLRSFRPEEVAKRVPIIQVLSDQEKRYQRLVDEIERSKKLQDIIADESKKAAFIALLESVREELAESTK
jgi:predicted component of type VI protein secretion system